MINNNVITNSSDQKDEFINNIRNLVNVNINAHTDVLTYEGLKIQLYSVIDIAKSIYRNLANVLPEFNSRISAGKLISVIYLKIHEMMIESKNAHIKDYIVKEKKILKIRKIALKTERKCVKCLFALYDLIQSTAVIIIPNYEKIVTLQNQLENMYNLRPRTAIYYGEEDGNFEDPKDDDYIFEEDEDDEEFDLDEDDNDSDYNPDDDADDTDEDFEFDEDDDEDNDDDYDYEDQDEYDLEDRQFISDYLNDPDYNPDEDEEDEEDDIEYDFRYLNNTVDDNENIVLKAAIADDNDEEDPDYDPSEDEDDEDDEDDEEDIKYINNKNIINICKRRFENGKVVYRWVKMTNEEAEKKYDEDYVCEEN